MSRRPEFLRVKNIIKEMVSWWYPGYPFSLHGVIDFKTKDCYLSSDELFNTKYNFSEFKKRFDSKLLYFIIDSEYVRKGSWLTNQYIPSYKTFIDNKDPLEKVFFIDNYEVVRLYFAVYAAIKEFKNTDKLLLFTYDGDVDYVNIQIFKNMDEINTYYKNYIKGE